MKTYELAYLISSELSEGEAQSFQAKIISFVQEEGGVLIEQKSPVKKKLAYAVKKQTQAYLAVINLRLLPEKLTAFEKKIKLEDKILRYLVLIKPPVREIKITRVLKRPKIEKPTKEKKVELKEIEKKLEEILNEPQ